MPNFFKDNPDLQFQFENLDLDRIVRVREEGFKQNEDYPFAPRDYDDALDNYRRILEVVGDIGGNFVAERAREVDELGSTFDDGEVTYAKGIQESLARLRQGAAHQPQGG